jgi:hypothetical protein
MIAAAAAAAKTNLLFFMPHPPPGKHRSYSIPPRAARLFDRGGYPRDEASTKA